MLPSRPLPDDDALDLREYLGVVRRQWRVVAITTAIVVAVALTVSFLQTPVYASSVEVLLQAPRSEEVFAPDPGGRTGPTRIQTEIGVMGSRSVREAVVEALGRDADVTIEAQGDTDLITVTAESTDPAQAALTANTYVEVYIENQRQRQVDDLQATIEPVQGKIAEIEAQLEGIDQPLVALDQAIADAESLVDVQALQAQRLGLQAQITAERSDIENQLAPYVDQLNQLQLASELTQTGGAQIVSRAVPLDEPIRPTPLRSGVFALIGGAMLGVAVAFLREHLDDTLKSKDDLQRASGGLNVLSLIPTVESWKDREQTEVVSLSEPMSPAAEAYRSLRTAVQFIGLDHPVKVIQVTSPNSSEGKTTTLANLAVALARAGQRVIVVCCDLRRPRIHEFVGLAGQPGFTTVLLGEAPTSAVLQGVPELGRLALIAAGPPPPNPSELLASKPAKEVLELLKSECDVLLVDSPPILPVTDGLVISRYVDATIVVATSGRTTRKEMQRSIELLNQVGAPVVGTVLNGVQPGGVYGYDGSSGYGYRTEAVKGTGEDDHVVAEGVDGEVVATFSANGRSSHDRKASDDVFRSSESKGGVRRPRS